MRGVYQSLHGEEILDITLHAGVERVAFAILNSELNVMHIGPDLSGVRAAAEAMHLKSTPKTRKLPEGIFHALKQAQYVIFKTPCGQVLCPHGVYLSVIIRKV